MRVKRMDLAEAATVLIAVGDGVLADSLRFSLELEGFDVRLCDEHSLLPVITGAETPGCLVLDHDVFARMGYEAECRKIQDLFLEGHKRDAIAAVPTRMIEDTALIGPVAKIRDDLAAWERTVVTTLLVGGPPSTLRQAAHLLSSY